MRTVLLAFLVIFTALRSTGQTEKRKPTSSETLQRLKTAFEHTLSGANIRDLNRDLEIRFDTLSQQYRVHIDPKTPLHKHTIDSLNSHINDILGNSPLTRLTGQVYFDRYTDHALVNIREYSASQLFQSVGTFVEPVGGIENFSRRLHDFLKAEADQGHIWMDGITDKTTIGFIVERDGLLINIADTLLRAPLDAFISREQKWSPGIMSGPPMVYELELRLYTNYLQGKAKWPEHPEWERQQILSWKKIGQNYMYSSLVRPDIPIVSLVYDAVAGHYKFPIAHAGSREEYSQLIMDIQENADKPPSLQGIFYRVYFYWKRN